MLSNLTQSASSQPQSVRRDGLLVARHHRRMRESAVGSHERQFDWNDVQMYQETIDAATKGAR
jgi:hypothetical protein